VNRRTLFVLLLAVPGVWTLPLPWLFSHARAAQGTPQSRIRDGDWPAYGRDAGGERFSPLDRITRENVASLQVAWTFRTGDAYEPKEGRATAFEATPLYVDGTLYLSTPLGRVMALDPVMGRPKWTFDARVPRDEGYGDFASRGVSTWARGAERRIFVATIDARLIAIDAATGRTIPSFFERVFAFRRRGSRITRSRRLRPSSATRLSSGPASRTARRSRTRAARCAGSTRSRAS
jgi:glucose dehydrogenase